MVADTSALLAMLLGEPGRDRFIGLLAEAHDPLISTATLLAHTWRATRRRASARAGRPSG
jgi:uncharacterized protein with PIN domain